jgi:DNA-binding protein HU-beta
MVGGRHFPVRACPCGENPSLSAEERSDPLRRIAGVSRKPGETVLSASNGRAAARITCLKVVERPRFGLHFIRQEKNMNKSELIDAIAAEVDIPRTTAGQALNAAILAIVSTVAKGGQVTLVGFGTFKSVRRAARKARNPRTGESIKVPAVTVPKFTVGATFKTAVAKKRKKS